VNENREKCRCRYVGVNIGGSFEVFDGVKRR